VQSPGGGYRWLERTADAVGVGGLSPFDHITVVGHSLGGNVAAMATRLFPALFDQAVVFNSARYNPISSAQKTDELLNLFSYWGLSPTAGFDRVVMYDSESQAPGNDISIVSSLLTGQLYGPRTLITTENRGQTTFSPMN
jgi:pimeloyl-ACP methyl ester carboxylesterase